MKTPDLCHESYPPVPRNQCFKHTQKESPFDIFPVATWTLVIGVAVSIIAVAVIHLHYHA